MNKNKGFLRVLALVSEVFKKKEEPKIDLPMLVLDDGEAIIRIKYELNIHWDFGTYEPTDFFRANPSFGEQNVLFDAFSLCVDDRDRLVKFLTDGYSRMKEIKITQYPLNNRIHMLQIKGIIKDVLIKGHDIELGFIQLEPCKMEIKGDIK